MDRFEAAKIVEKMIYKPGWRVIPDFGSALNRLYGDDHLIVKIIAYVPDSSPEYAPEYRKMITTPINHIIDLMYVNTELDLHREMIYAMISLEVHESLEFYRNIQTLGSPFHPHTEQGKLNWRAVVQNVMSRVARTTSGG